MFSPTTEPLFSVHNKSQQLRQSYGAKFEYFYKGLN